MMKWQNKNRKLEGYWCVTLERTSNKLCPIVVDELEDCLAGELGEIWHVGGRIYKCFQIARGGAENLVTFDMDEMATYIKRLKIPVQPDRQAKWANNPNQRHDVWRSKHGKL